jgi:hypothetical protein
VGQHSENSFEHLSVAMIAIAENAIEREATTPISSDTTIRKKKKVFKDGSVLLPPSSSYLYFFVVH